ncbi:hypothetical protein GOB94_03670 [Granulicella sp. 5B5]|uniref:hypothetical protein n=1 Tax=Granulicella sp. 5B5 TaxID=1617967 RepID=UPI0015F46231|nr:hypothetical protein [Granulicella sp. 5B5]QMV17889.1 hypothetical protein GOB94_03670 [Granulicella sp. 5B5]
MRPAEGSWWVWLFALAIGAVFVLPHMVRIAEVGYAAYSPFTARSPSAMVYDETFLYSAEANYTLTRHAPAYDDTWEHRAAVYPYSILPTAAEALLAAGLHSLKLAHVVASFVFPCLTALLLMTIFIRAGAGRVLAALLALVVLVVAFSPMTLLMNVRAFVHHAQGARVVDTLQAARSPNPEMTFLQFAGALLLLAMAIRRRSWVWAAGAGLLGGLLFFSYVYYAIAWTVLLGVLSAVALVRPSVVSRVAWITLAKTAVFAAMFLLWEHVSKADGNYFVRAVRIGLYHSHLVVGENLRETEFWTAQALVCAAVWLWLRRRAGGEFTDALMVVLLAAMAGGLAGMDMQVVTGFNVQQVQHYPHMVLQPVGFMMMAVLAAMVWPAGRAGVAVAGVGFAVLLSAAMMAQVEGGRDTASMHAMPQAERGLFAWLNAKTPVGSVVATDELELSIVLPVETHNSVLFANGSRSSASDDELLERFLLASRLVGEPSEVVESELSGEMPADVAEPPANYSLYLFEFSKKYQRRLAERRVAPAWIPVLLQRYATMDLAQELQRFRVDYVWVPTGRMPVAVTGWRYAEAFSSTEGTLWQLKRD